MRWLLCLTLLLPVIAVSPAAGMDLYDFQIDAQGFYLNQRGELFPYGDPALSWNPAVDCRQDPGSGSLQLDLDLQGAPTEQFDATIIQSPDWGSPGQQTWNISGADRLNVMVYVPEGGPETLEGVVFTKSGKDWSWSQGPWTSLVPGKWNRLSIATTSITEPAKVEAMGVKVGGNVFGGGTVFIDRFYTSNTFTGLSFDFDYNYRIVTAPGYTSTPVAAYTPETGHGYKNLFRIYSMSRVIENPLRQDFHFSYYESEFLVDLENGGYEVSVHFGDIYNALDHMQVFAEGALKAADLSAAKQEFKTETFLVEVADGQLNLKFRDDGGVTPYWLFNGIEIRLPEVDTEPPITSADLPGGAYVGCQQVTLTANEPATIYYTTDGSTPTTTSAVYVQSIPLAGNAVVRFFGVDATNNVETPFNSIAYEIQLPSNEQRLDFDSYHQNTAVGYTGIPVAAYDSGTGFGYKNVVRIYTAHQAYGNALLRDSHYSYLDSEFMIDLQNGPYTVTVHSGDRFAATDQVDVYAEGERVLTGLSTAAGSFREDTFAVEIADGRLNLLFHDGGGSSPFWMINGIDLVYTGQDTTPPVSQAIPGGGEYQASQQILLTADEPATIFYTLDGTPPTEESPVYSAPLEISQDATLRFFARDTAGNSESPPHTETYIILPPDPYAFQVDLSATSVGTYEKLEVTAAWDDSAGYTNPFDPQEVELTGIFTDPDGGTLAVPGFYDGDAWRIRFSPGMPGEWSCQVQVTDGNGTNAGDPLHFTCTTGDAMGWIRASLQDPHYFVHDDGTPFYGIGHNRCWSLEQLGWTAENGYALFTDMASSGMNVLGFWMAPWDTQLVTPASGYDRYDMNRALELDAIVEDAEQKGIRLLLAIWAHDALRDAGHPWGNGQWSENPFNELTSCNDFLTDTTSWAYQEKLYRYIIARWGYSTAIGWWHTIAEIEGIGTTSAITSAKNQWHDRINRYFQQNDPFRHPTTGSNTHWSGLWTSGYHLMDAPQIHIYEATGDPVGIAGRIAYWTGALRSNQNKPAVIGEFGTSNSALQPAHMHNAAWAGLAGGGAMTPLDWNDGGAWGDMTPDMFASMAVLAEFVEGLPFGIHPLTPVSVSTDGCDAWGMADGNMAFGWILAPNANPVTGESLTINGLADGDYTLQWWDPWTGAIQEQPASVFGGTLSASVPNFSKDCAFKLLESAP